MRPRREDADTVDGVKAEAALRELCERYGVGLKTAAERISMSQSTPWRWKNEGLRPMPWQVNLLVMSVLELAEKKGPLSADDAARLATFRGSSKPAPVAKPSLAQVRRLRAQLAEAERLLAGAGK